MRWMRVEGLSKADCTARMVEWKDVIVLMKIDSGADSGGVLISDAWRRRASTWERESVVVGGPRVESWVVDSWRASTVSSWFCARA